MGKTFLFFILLSLTHFLLGADEFVLQLKWHHQFQFAGYYMAAQKGYYEEAGLHITIREGGPSVDVSQEVLSGNADFGILGAELMLHYDDGKDFVVLAPLMQHSIRAIFANRNKGIYSLNDLFGKRIMLNTNELPEFEAMFKKEGISLDSLSVEPKNGNAYSLFIDGELDALNGSIANQPFAFDQAGMEYIAFRPITYGIDFYGDTLFSTGSLARGESEMVNSFLEASLKGWQYAFDNPEESVRVIIDKYGSTKSPQMLFGEYNVLKDLIAPELVQIGHNNPERWKHIEDTYRSLGLIEGEINYDHFIFNPDYKRDLFYRFLIGSGVFLLIIAISVLIFLFFSNRNLNRIVYLKSAQLQSVIESMPFMLIGIDSSIAITLWNKEAQEITGLQEADAVGKNLFQILPVLKPMSKKITFHLKEGTSFRNARLKSHNKTKEVYRDISLFPLKGDASDCAVLKVEDVTRQVELSESLARNDKLMSLGRMAAGMAHEINNPLAGIVQSISVMENRLIKKIKSDPNLDNKALSTYLEEKNIPRLFHAVNEAAMRISHIVDGFLAYSRKQSDKSSVFSLPDLIENTLDLASIEYNLKNEYDFTDIEIYRDYDHGLPGLESYRGKLQQVLLNILRNGAQEMHKTGTVDPRFIISVKYNNQKGFLISVEDNGPGIPDSAINKIFDPFYTTKDQGEGTGLGLSMSYYLITEQLGGMLRVESPLDRGARFIIELPQSRTSEPEYYI